MDRKKHIALADTAVIRAERLAADAERKAIDFGEGHKVAPLAAAGALWADIARAHAAIAQAMTDTEEK